LPSGHSFSKRGLADFFVPARNSGDIVSSASNPVKPFNCEAADFGLQNEKQLNGFPIRNPKSAFRNCPGSRV
jgi:hypothetical protein